MGCASSKTRKLVKAPKIVVSQRPTCFFCCRACEFQIDAALPCSEINGQRWNTGGFHFSELLHAFLSLMMFHKCLMYIKLTESVWEPLLSLLFAGQISESLMRHSLFSPWLSLCVCVFAPAYIRFLHRCWCSVSLEDVQCSSMRTRADDDDEYTFQISSSCTIISCVQALKVHPASRLSPSEVSAGPGPPKVFQRKRWFQLPRPESQARPKDPQGSTPNPTCEDEIIPFLTNPYSQREKSALLEMTSQHCAAK